MILLAPLLSDQKLLRSARTILEHLARHLDTPLCVRLWDDSTVPLGQGSPFEIAIHGPGVIGSLVRRDR